MAEAMRAKSLGVHANGDDQPLGGRHTEQHADHHPARQHQGVRECLEVVQPVLRHAIELLQRETGERAPALNGGTPSPESPLPQRERELREKTL